MQRLTPALVAGFFLLSGSCALAQSAGAVTPKKPDRGWFWYEKPPVVEEPAPVPAQPVEPAPPPSPPPTRPKPEPTPEPPPACTTASTWNKSCGFVDPGEDFDFQALQRDELLKQMSVKRNDPEAVEAFQRYIKWVMGRASEVANLWHYNMVQNPELDPNVTSPVSSFGLDLASRVKTAEEGELFSYLGEVGRLIYFSKDDCVYCHQMAGPLRELARQTGMPIANVAIDGVCLEGYAECESGEVGVRAAEALQVTIVPALYLHVEPDTWIRVATGLTDAGTMRSRVAQFFTSYRHAMLKGINNGANLRPAQDGSYTWRPSGASAGVELPSSNDVKALLSGASQ